MPKRDLSHKTLEKIAASLVWWVAIPMIAYYIFNPPENTNNNHFTASAVSHPKQERMDSR